MKIASNMNLSDLAERMGDVATESEAAIMRSSLISGGYDGADTADVPVAEWESYLNLTIE